MSNSIDTGDLKNFIATMKTESSRYALKVFAIVENDPEKNFPLQVVTDDASYCVGKREGIDLVLNKLRALIDKTEKEESLY